MGVVGLDTLYLWGRCFLSHSLGGQNLLVNWGTANWQSSQIVGILRIFKLHLLSSQVEIHAKTLI